MENVLSILFCLSLFYLALTSRVKAYVSVLKLQGILLTVIIVFPFINRFSWHVLVIPLILFVVKVILIPRYINRVLERLAVKKTIESSIQQFNFLLLVIVTLVTIFVTSSILARTSHIDIIPFASGFSAVVVGIYIIIFRRKLIVHVAGFLVMENGIFLFGTAVASQLPVIIEIGILLDVFVVVFLMGIALNRISSTLSGFDVTAIRRLKD